MNAFVKKIKNSSENFGAKWAQWVVKNRWLVLISTIGLTMLAGYGGKNIGFDSDYHVFFSEDNPELMAYDALQNTYTKDDQVLIMIEPKNGDVFTRENLAAIEELTDSAWQTPYSSRVDAITNYQHTRAVDDDLYVDDLIEGAMDKTDAELQEIKEIATNEPLLIHRLVDEEGTVTAINVTVKLPEDDMMAPAEVMASVRAMVADFEEKNPGMETYLTGMVMLSGAFFESSANDMGTLMPLMMLIILGTILIATRTITGTFSALLVIIMSIMIAAGLGGWMGILLTPPSAAFMTIVMTLAIADSIHILITFMQYMRKGVAKHEAIVQSLRVNFMPVFITSLTTVIGFLSMNFSDAPPFHDLGNLTSIGMTAAFLLSITLLPAILAILPVRVKVKKETEGESNTLLGRLAEFVIANNKKVLWGSTSIVVALALFVPQIELNEEFVKYFDESIAFRTDTDRISEKLTGIYSVEFSVGSGEDGGINNPAYLAKLNEFEEWLYDQPEVLHVNTYGEVARKVNKSMHGDDPAYYKMPEGREEAAQYLLLYEMSLPFGLDLNNQINVDKSETRVIATAHNMSSGKLMAFNDRAEEWLANNTPEPMHALGTSTSMMFSRLSYRQFFSLLNGNLLALFLISGVLIFALRSFKYGVLSLIPNLTPLLISFGIWGLFVGEMNMGMSVVFGMTLGIIVDDTVHFLSKYLRARRELGYSPEDAIRFAFSTVGMALLVTSFVLIAGFTVLTQSSFGMNSGMAKITTIIISSALVLDFLLLPALLLAVGKFEKNPKLNTLEAEPVVTTVKAS